jgi:diguanylate cyclase (GGDEF)-like protein
MWAQVTAGEVWQGELYNRRKDGALYLEEQTITPVRAGRGEITHFVAIKLEITARKHQEEQIRYLAMHDALTDLPNRRLLTENLERMVHQARRGRRGALMVIDVDDFKVVNDSFGHAAGDQLLRQLAELIVGSLRPGDFVARFGGDEFAVIIEGSDLDDAVATAERLKTVRAPVLIIYGVEDAIPLEQVREWTALPNSRLLELEGAGHFPHAEKPDIVFPASEEFLRERRVE